LRAVQGDGAETGAPLPPRADDDGAHHTPTHTHTNTLSRSRPAVPFAGCHELGRATQAARLSVADTAGAVVATCSASAHFEVVEIAPPVGALEAMLAARPYGERSERNVAAMTHDSDGDGGCDTAAPAADHAGFTWGELVERVQCSEAQLREALAGMHALHLHGRWLLLEPGTCMLNAHTHTCTHAHTRICMPRLSRTHARTCAVGCAVAAYMQSVLDVVILTAAAHGWSLSSFSHEDMVAAVAADGYDAAVVAHCLGVYGAEQRGDGAGAAWAMDAGAVCVARARTLLADTPRWRMEEFMSAWRAAVPEARARDVWHALAHAGTLACIGMRDVPCLLCWRARMREPCHATS
jgi:sister chromatid cohesion protein DCC1